MHTYVHICTAPRSQLYTYIHTGGTIARSYIHTYTYIKIIYTRLTHTVMHYRSGVAGIYTIGGKQNLCVCVCVCVCVRWHTHNWRQAESVRACVCVRFPRYSCCDIHMDSTCNNFKCVNVVGQLIAAPCYLTFLNRNNCMLMKESVDVYISKLFLL
jgi:hypothetical protein